MTNAADLTALGDALEAAAAADLATAPRPPRRRRRIIVTAVVAGAALAGTTGVVAAATGVFDSGQVARGMPNGATMFQGTTPKCTEVEPGVVFRCLVPGGPSKVVDVQSSYKGVIEVLSSDDLVVSGGCRGQDDAGTVWLCYVGQRAVDEGLIAQDFLGTKQLAPGGVG